MSHGFRRAALAAAAVGVLSGCEHPVETGEPAPAPAARTAPATALAVRRLSATAAALSAAAARGEITATAAVRPDPDAVASLLATARAADVPEEEMQAAVAALRQVIEARGTGPAPPVAPR